MPKEYYLPKIMCSFDNKRNEGYKLYVFRFLSVWQSTGFHSLRKLFTGFIRAALMT